MSSIDQVGMDSAAFGEMAEEDKKDVLLHSSMSRVVPNNFQYSYTKFLSDRQSKLDTESAAEMNQKHDKTGTGKDTEAMQTHSKKSYKISTETEQYGSLKSGLIYQTAVNEPVSVMASADFTVIKFDYELPNKMLHSKKSDLPKKPLMLAKQQPKRFGDLMQKIAALFNNNSQVKEKKKTVPEHKIEKENSHGFNKRKLLSSSNTDEAIVPKVKREVPIRPYDEMAATTNGKIQSNSYTTGVITSTTGTDVVNGRTTEWTTIIEGTYIDGIYAHIVQSTSKIFYTVGDESPTHSSKIPDVTKSSNILTSMTSIMEMNSEHMQDNSPTILSNEVIKDSSIATNSSDLEYDNESNENLDALINILSNSAIENTLSITPTPIIPFELNEDVTPETKDVTPDIKNVAPINRSDDPGIISLSSEEITTTKQATTIQNDYDLSNSKESSSKIEDDALNINFNTNTEETVSDDEGLLLENNVGRMAIPINREDSELNLFVRESNLTKFDLSEEENTMPTLHSVLSSSTFEKRINSIDNKDTVIKLTNENSSPTPVYEFPTVTSDDHSSKMETSLRIPELTDLLLHFDTETKLNSNIETVRVHNINIGVDSKSSNDMDVNTAQEINATPVFGNLDVIIETPSHASGPDMKDFLIKISSSIIASDSIPEITLDNPNIYSGIKENTEDQNSHIVRESKSLLGNYFVSEADTTTSSVSEVMVFLGIASTVTNTQTMTTRMNSNNEKVTENVLLFPSEFPVIHSSLTEISREGTHMSSLNEDIEMEALSIVDPPMKDSSDITVLLLPSLNLEELKTFVESAQVATPVEINPTEMLELLPVPSSDEKDKDITEIKKDGNSDDLLQRKKRDIGQSVTVLGPEGRIISTDARVYLTPTTHYTTYTYFTTILKPGGGTEIKSSLHVDSVIIDPTERQVYGLGDGHCCDGDVRHTVIDDRHIGRPYGDEYHVETVPYDAGRASEVTHKTTYTFYTTRFRGGTSVVDTRKETETNVTPIPTGRYSPFEIGTYYDPHHTEVPHYHTGVPHYHTEAPYIEGARPHDITHRTTYTYYTTRFRNGIPIVETRKETDTNATPIPTFYRPGHLHTGVVRTQIPGYSQRIDPNLYRPDSVTHKTTYTYHTTRFRDGIPIVNTREETETNATPIPTYTRPGTNQRRSQVRVVPTRVVVRPVDRTVPHGHYPHRDSDPYITHRTTFTYYTTRLRGGEMHVDTNYVTETNLTPNLHNPHVRATTTYAQPDYYDDTHYETECPVCREQAQRNTPIRHVPNERHRDRVRGRNPVPDTRRPQRIDSTIKPSTATLLTTYTYATTQLAHGGTPVVRTREHTVTEVLSDVVLPTLRYGDRIRSKRETNIDENVPLNNERVGRNLIRPTFSRTNSYADGRDGRRIANRNSPQNHGNGQERSNSVVRNHAFHPNDINRSSNLNNIVQPHNEIKPTSITYYSTYTYFTTELGEGTPVIKTREHTVTEILTDVIVPTVSSVGRNVQNTRAIGYATRNRHTRSISSLSLKKSKKVLKSLGRKLLSFSEEFNETLDNSTEIQSLPTAATVNDTVTLPTEIFENASKNLNIDFNMLNETTKEIDFLGKQNTPIVVSETEATSPETIHIPIQNISLNDQFTTPIHNETINTEKITIIANNDDKTDLSTPFINKSINFDDDIRITITPSSSYMSDLLLTDNNESKLPIHQNENSSLLRNESIEIGLTLSTVKPNLVIESSIFPSLTTFKNSEDDFIPIILLSHITPVDIVSSLSISSTTGTGLTGTNADNLNTFNVLRTPTINDFQSPTPSKILVDGFSNLDFLDLVPGGDLEAEGAEVKHAAIATPTTHFTTYTYYATALKPGGKIEVETSTKVVASTYYNQLPDSPSGYHNAKVHNNRHKPYDSNSKNYKKYDESLSNIRPSRRYDLQPQRAFPRTYTAYPNIQHNEPYRPSFATKVRGPSYHTHNAAENKCATCLRSSSRQSYQDIKIDNNYGKLPGRHTYLTSVPVLRASTHYPNSRVPYRSPNTITHRERLIKSSIPVTRGHSRPANLRKVPDRASNNIVYHGPEIKPTHVTYYSTYTYFTTELLDGSPTIRSREHTVTEILTDVIVPTVASLHSQGATRSPHQRRGRRQIFNDESVSKSHLNNINQQYFFPKRNLLSKDPFLELGLRSSIKARRLRFSRKKRSANLRRLGDPSAVSNSGADIHFTFDAAEAAEKVVQATPVTHYTTHTYYKTLLKPGNKREIETSTKLVSSIYYPDIQPATAFTGNRVRTTVVPSNYRGTNNQARCVTCRNRSEPSRYQKPYYLPPKREDVRNLQGAANYRDIKHNNRQQSIIHHAPEIQPSLVTFYSTYTYFTTELGGPTPIIRSREHTVTEILSDVIVPTVMKVRPKRSIESMNLATVVSHVHHRKLLVADGMNSEINERLEEEKQSYPQPINKESNEKVMNENSLISSFTIKDISTESSKPFGEIDDDFLNKAQFSKAYAAYMDFLQSSNLPQTISAMDVNLNKNQTINNDHILLKASKVTKYAIPKVTATVSDLQPSLSETENMISVLTSSAKRNGRMTKYTTTIFGTYINGVYAQKAKSSSEIVPITETDMAKAATTLMFNPSRMSGLVRSIVSRKVRGPVAVHLTTEIHGIFVGGAYAQTARVYTSSQPLSTTREPFRYRQPSHSTTTTTLGGTRQTGLLSTRVIRSKVDGSTTLLFVSEIYGTHIGGAYAHLGTYTTRTITPADLSMSSVLSFSQLKSTYYMEDLTTGLITASVSEKVANDTTTRYHYEVYGTYLDGTYAHVPSISTETITPVETSILTIDIDTNFVYMSSINRDNIENSSPIIKISDNLVSNIHTIDFIGVSTVDPVENGTKTYENIEVHSTETFSKDSSVNVQDVDTANKNFNNEELKLDYEILTIFTTTPSADISTNLFNYEEGETIIIADEKDMYSLDVNMNTPGNEGFKESLVRAIDKPVDDIYIENDRDSMNNQFPQQPPFVPILLPEALRTSFSHASRNHRFKRNEPPLPVYLQSSFAESIYNQRKTRDFPLTTNTTPLPASALEELSLDQITSVSTFKHVPKTMKHTCQDCLSSSSYVSTLSKKLKKELYSKGKIQVNRPKRSASTRTTFGSKRFGISTSTTARKFRSSLTFKKDQTTSSNRASTRGYNSARQTPNTILKTNSQTKSLPNFLLRNQRSKPIPSVSKLSTTSIKPTSTTGYAHLSTRARKFGKKPSEEDFKGDEEFEASEAVVQSVTEENSSSSTPTPRFRRPAKFSKFNSRTTTPRNTVTKGTPKPSLSSSRLIRPSLKTPNRLSNKRKNSRREYSDDTSPSATTEMDVTSKRRFTLTTTFSLSIKPTSSFMDTIEDEDGNNLQEESIRSKRKNKNRSSSSNSRNRQGSSYKPVFDIDDNEVFLEKPKALPLPVFGRTRGTKRPPKFDPRTIRSTSTSTSPITYITGETTPVLDDSDLMLTSSTNGPITVTDIFTTTKTLPVHLGARTSFATITTTAYSTSVIQPEDLTTVTIGGRTKTLLSAVTGFPDANLPLDKQFTVVTEVILTSTEIENTSLVAIKVGYGTRTDTVINRQIFTTLTTQTNTLMEQKSSATQIQQPFNPYFQNPFAPPVPQPNQEFSLSLSENSFVSTQTVTATTVLTLFLNGKTIFTTLTNTKLNEETLIKTATVKVPQAPSAQPFIFPQPVFILPSVTTEVTVHFTAQNGEIFSIVTLITVPLQINGHTRYARSVEEIDSTSTLSSGIIGSTESHLKSYEETLNTFGNDNFKLRESIKYSKLNLQSSFTAHENEGPTTSNNIATHSLNIALNSNDNNNINDISELPFLSKVSTQSIYKSVNKLSMEDDSSNPTTFNKRKLLQVDEVEEEDLNLSNKNNPNSEENLRDIVGTQSENQRYPSENRYGIDTFHLLGAGVNDETSERPIPSVRVIPTRRAYIRRIRPESPPQLTPEDLRDEYNFRNNPQNFPSNIPNPNYFQMGPGRVRNENYGITRNVPTYAANIPLPPQDLAVGNYGPVRGMQYYSPNRPNNFPPDVPQDNYGRVRAPQNYVPSSRLNRQPERYERVRNPGNGSPNRPNLSDQDEGYDAIRTLPSYSPTRQSIPPLRNEDAAVPTYKPDPETIGPPRNRAPARTRQPSTTTSPRRVIRLRRPVAPQQSRPQPDEDLLDRKPIINSVPDNEAEAEYGSPIRARGPASPSQDSRRPNRIRGNDDNDISSNGPKPAAAVPLTYYTTFTYMTTFLNGPSTAYSTREAVVSNIATETLNPRLVGLIRTRGGFTTQNGIQTAVPLGSRAQGATTTIVNLASRVQLYNSDVYYGSKLPESLSGPKLEEEELKPADASPSTVHITDVAALPKTYYTLFTYYYTLRDGDKSTHSQRSETITNVDSQTAPFLTQDFTTTIDGSGYLTLKPNKQLVNLGLRTAGGTTTEVNLELKTIVHFDDVKNAVIDRGSITPTLIEVGPSETGAIYNNYLEPDDAEVQDQQTYPQTVPIQPSFSSDVGSASNRFRSSANTEATPEIPENNRVIRTQAQRGPLRIATTVLQRPGSLRSGTFANRPGVRVRVRPVSTRVPSSIVFDSETEDGKPDPSTVTSFDSSRESNEDKTSVEEVDDEDIDDDDEDEYTTTEEDVTTTEDTNQGNFFNGLCIRYLKL